MVNRWKGVAGLPYEVVDAKHYDALAARLAEAERDAALGRIAIKFVDRAGDYCAVDPPEMICSEFHAAMAAEVDRQFQERMQRDAAASTVGDGQ